MHIRELAERLGATIDDSIDVEITGVATVQDAGPEDLTFLANPLYEAALDNSGAGAVLVATGFERDVRPVALRVPNPYLAFARSIDLLLPETVPQPGVHETAVMGQGITVGSDVSIGAYSVLGDNVVIGDRVVIHPHCVIYEGARIGDDSVLHSQSVVRQDVTLGKRVILQCGAVIGSDGFGFAPRGDGSWRKITQAGTVEIGDDVEIQALACIDRAAIGRTTIARGTKVDNLVQVGHGSTVGEDSLLCGQVGLAGSTEVGDRVTLAGQVGVAGHCRIADDVTVAAQSGVPGSIREAGIYAGVPIMPIRHSFRVIREYRRLPETAQRIKALEERLAALEKKEG